MSALPILTPRTATRDCARDDVGDRFCHIVAEQGYVTECGIPLDSIAGGRTHTVDADRIADSPCPGCSRPRCPDCALAA